METTFSILLFLTFIAQIGILFRLFTKKDSFDLNPLLAKFDAINSQSERSEKSLREEIAKNREELARTLKENSDTGLKQIELMNSMVRNQLLQISEGNEKKLEEMRKTVDEKLQSTLEKRLGESFKLVSDRLEAVHKGLGEMQNLATGVGDLKRVLTNVKTRGTWGEVQLRAILEQMMLPSQFEANVKVKPNTKENVEFAIKLPGNDGMNTPVWLPIDSKFPKENFERILEAQDRADAEGVKTSRDELAKSLKLFAKTIRDLYIEAPYTTDFGILFLPTEGLFAEACQYPGLLDQIQRDYRITVAGPTTLAALLNSLQMGFQTLAIQERSSEVWSVLGAVKTEFSKYGELLDAVDKKLDEAKNKISAVAGKTTTINRKLKKVQELPHQEADQIFLDTEID